MIIGREKEIEQLSAVLNSASAEFIAIYGRRRVGKTYLMHQYFQDKGIYFELTGRKDASKNQQLNNFSQTYRDVFNEKINPKDWDEAFYALKEKIVDQAAVSEKPQKVILFLDELPWLATAKSGFLEALDFFWNRYFSRLAHCILIVCGSAAEWMIKKIIANKAGLHNRLTRPPIQLMPFTLHETERYLLARHITMERKQIIDIYMALGGVAYYLNLIPQGKSSTEIIHQLFFVDKAFLRTEFYHLFSSLYQHSEKHVKIIQLLATTRQGLVQSEIINKIPGLSSGGGIMTVLEELEQCGFILKLQAYGKKKKEAHYRLIDAFSLFYLKWVADIGETGEAYWLRKKGTAAYYTWAGYAFENICFQHYPVIIKALELSVVAEAKSGWVFKGNEQMQGVQIDLIIDRSDQSMNICEIKFYDDEWIMNKDDAIILKRKKQVFREVTKTKKAVFITVISTYGVKKNAIYLDCVDQQLTMDVLF